MADLPLTRKTKRELIVEIFESSAFPDLSQEAITEINQRLCEIHGPGGAASLAYIAETLLAAGKRIRYQADLEPPADPDEFSDELAGLLKFDTLATAEQAIRTIDRYYRRYSSEGYREGVVRCQDFAKRARIRAQLIADNGAVAPESRALKAEIAFWLEIWLRTPELFDDWLALRKMSRDFCTRFGSDIK